MNAQLPMTTDYQAVRAQLEEAILPNLAEFEDRIRAGLPEKLAEEMRGIHIKNTDNLLCLFTPELYADCLETYNGELSFIGFCLREMNEKIAFMALVSWPVAYDREGSWSALSFYMDKWTDKVSIKGEDAPETSFHASSTVRNVIWVDGEFVPEQIEEIYEAFDGDLDKAKAVYRDFTGGCATGMAMDDLTQLGGEIALGIPYTTDKNEHPDEVLFKIDEEPVSNLVEAFERQFSQEEAEAISAGFDGDVKRAASLYRELTEDYVSSMSVEDLIKAGKENA